MEGLVGYLNEIYDNCKLPFNVYVDGESVFETNPVDSSKDFSEHTFFMGKNKIVIEIEKNHKDALKFIEFCIKTKYKDKYSNKEKVVVDLLNNNFVTKEKIDDLPYSENITYLISINIREKLEEAIEALKNIYDNTEVIILKYFDDLTINEISKVLDKPEGTIKTYLNKGLNALRLYIGREIV